MTFLWVLCLPILNGCSNHEESNTKKPAENGLSEGWKEFKSDSLHFSIAFPKGWEARLNGSRVGIFELKKDSTDTFEDNIIIWVEEMPVAIPDSLYAVAAVTEFRIKNPDISPSKLPARQIGNLTFHPFSFEYTNKRQESFSILGYTKVEGNRGYNFSCTALKNDMSAHQASFDSILSTFKPL